MVGLRGALIVWGSVSVSVRRWIRDESHGYGSRSGARKAHLLVVCYRRRQVEESRLHNNRGELSHKQIFRHYPQVQQLEES